MGAARKWQNDAALNQESQHCVGLRFLRRRSCLLLFLDLMERCAQSVEGTVNLNFLMVY